MKNVVTFLFLISAMCISALAQPLISEFNKAKEIKLLESTPEDVKRILVGYEHDNSDDESYSQDFSTKFANIEVDFSYDEDCSVNTRYWNVPGWKVTKIKITTEDNIKIKDFNFDFSKYKKEIEDEEFPESYIYHDEANGVAFVIEDEEIEKVVIYPPKSKISLLCNNEATAEIISGEKPFSALMYDKYICINIPAKVDDITLSKEELIICNKSEKNKKCSANNMKVSVTTAASDAENDPLVYDYTVSAGKIVGSGFNVVWDLSGVAPGVYTITAGVDDGCGICGETKTKEVVVK